MGSLGAMSERNDVNRYSQDGVEKEKMVPEGVEGRVPFKGWVVSVIDQLTGGIRQSMGYVGCKTISSNANRYSICRNYECRNDGKPCS